jgi:CheY-like chemotaxis protein
MNNSDPSEDVGADDARPGDQLVAARVADLLAARGVGDRDQAGALAEILAIGSRQARRKIRGAATWTADEIIRVAAHLKEPIGKLFGHQGHAVDLHRGILVAGTPLKCTFELETASHAPVHHLVAVQEGGSWAVGTPGYFRDRRPDAELVPVSAVYIENPRLVPRVALVEDQAIFAETLVKLLQARGYLCDHFESDEELLSAGAPLYDAYLLDWKLLGHTSYDLIKAIRRGNSTVPIFVLTAVFEHEGAATSREQSELLAAVADHGLTLIAKPAPLEVIRANLDAKLSPRDGGPNV